MEMKKFWNFALLLALILIVGYSTTNFIGLSRSGFDSSETLGLQSFYIIGGVFAFILFLLQGYAIFIKDDDEYGTSIGFSSQEEEEPYLSIFKGFSNFQLLWFSIIVFLFLGLLNQTIFPEQKSYTGAGVLQTQQFTATDSLIYSTLLIPVAENLGSAVVIALLMISFAYFFNKWNISPINYTIAIFLAVPLAVGIFGLGNHLLRYGGRENALTSFFFFWFFGGLITLLTKNFIPFWIMHDTNNLFLDLSRFFSNDLMFLYVGGTWVVLTIGYFFTYGLKGGFSGAKN